MVVMEFTLRMVAVVHRHGMIAMHHTLHRVVVVVILAEVVGQPGAMPVVVVVRLFLQHRHLEIIILSLLLVLCILEILEILQALLQVVLL